jgi:hypothetical protein
MAEQEFKVSSQRGRFAYKGPVIKQLLGWAGVIWDGPWKIFGQFRWAANYFVCLRLGHQTKKPCLLSSRGVGSQGASAPTMVAPCGSRPP